jgi:hypothetical protein
MLSLNVAIKQFNLYLTIVRIEGVKRKTGGKQV